MASSRKVGFLTEEQRQVLRIATLNAEATLLSASPKSPTSSALLMHYEQQRSGSKGGALSPRQVRRTHSGKHIKVKKDGAGGKGTWGKLIDTDSPSSCLDQKDPNYDSDEEPYELVWATAVPSPFNNYKKLIIALIEEYFSHGDVHVATSDLADLGHKNYLPYFVKRLVSMSLDRHDKEKEMASVLLSSLYVSTLTSDQIGQGFVLLLKDVDDLVLDIPDAIDILALFTARAIVDDILAPAFLEKTKDAFQNSLRALQVLNIAEKSYLSAPHHAELVERRWGGCTCMSVEGIKRRIVDLLKEYAETGDAAEACRRIRELNAPFFHHEVVKRALTLAMESRALGAAVMRLLKGAAEEGLISSSQMVKGFRRMSECLDDLCLDIPTVKPLFRTLSAMAVSEGWLDGSGLTLTSVDGEVDDKRDFAELQQYKGRIVPSICEYFLSDDIPEVIRCLEELSLPQFNPVFVKKLVSLAMDRKNREKEMASVLLSALRIELFSTEDVVEGFTMLLESADDAALDVIDTSHELALFLARAVVDDVLSPLNLLEIARKVTNGSSETVAVARAIASARHAGERLSRCWGGGTGWAVEDAKEKIARLLEEYESGRDLVEACRCVREVGMPFFNHEVVKRALVMAIERKDDGVMEVIKECFSEGIITVDQMTKGFRRVSDGIDDLALDVPDARAKFETYVECARVNGWLLPSFTVTIPAAVE